MKNTKTLLALLCSSAALAIAPAALAQEAPRLFFEGDMVRGPVPGSNLTACVLTSHFKRNEPVVWRIRVLDARTGRALDDKGLKSLEVLLPDGQKFATRFGPHPRGKKDDFFWTVSWKVPENYPTGTIGYKVVATDLEGRATTWEPFKISLSQLTIVP